MNSFSLSIITPNGNNFTETTISLIAPGVNGFVGILANHTPFICELAEGILTVKNETAEKFYAIGTGVLEVHSDHSVLVLTDYAKKVNSDKIAELKS